MTSGTRPSRPGFARLDVGLVLVLAIALAVRVVFASAAPMFLEGDSQSYLLPAWELANGDGFSPELRRTPVYPLFIALSFALFGQDLGALAVVQHALGLGTVALTYVLGVRLFGRWAGVLAALALALSGPQLIYERYLMTEALFGFVLAGVCLALVVAVAPRRASVGAQFIAPSFGAGSPQQDRHGLGQGAMNCAPTKWSLVRASSAFLPLVAGLAIGIASLTRPVAQAILPLFLLALVLALPRWRSALKAVGLAVAGYALIIAPWTARNLAAHESLTASGGLGRSLIARTVKYDTLFDWKWLSETYGGREDIAGRSRMLLYRKRANIPASRSVRPYQDALVEELGLSQGRADGLMREIALEAIARRPLEYVVGSLRFTAQVFVGSEERLQSHWKQRASKDWAEQWDNRLDFLVTPVAPWSGTETGTNQGALADQLAGFYQPARFSWLLAMLFLAGCAFATRDRVARPALLLGGITMSLLALSAFLDGPAPRYRHPLDPLISVLAAGGLVGGVRVLIALWSRIRKGERKQQQAQLTAPVPLREG